MTGTRNEKGPTAKIRQELETARRARAEGNEGRARVCARRAAGWAIESKYAGDLAERLPEGNALRYLLWFNDQERFPQQLRASAGRLTARVNEEFELPFEQDPLEDAERIVNWIFS